MKDLFTTALEVGSWKWWFSLIVCGLALFMFDAQSWVVISVVVPILLSLKVSNTDQGLVTDNFKKTLFIGFLSFVIFTILVYIFENLSEKASEAGEKVMDILAFGKSKANDWGMVLLICFWAPLSEELLYRGVVFRSIWNSISVSKKLKKYKKTIAFVIATFISSFLFMSIHGGEGQDDQLIMIFILAAIACASYLITGSIYAPVLFHALNNSYVIFKNSSNFVDANMKYYILLMPIAVCLVLFILQKLLQPLEKFDFRKMLSVINPRK